MHPVTADTAVSEVLSVAAGLPVFITGSSVAAIVHDKPLAYTDVDVFCAQQTGLVASVQRFLSEGWDLAERSERVWIRWLTNGMDKWHTNSIKLTRGGIEVNCISKLVDGHQSTSLSQVIESFDFGLLALGYDARDGVLRDMRSYYFPGEDTTKALPMLPIRERAWREGFISQYQGLREVGRYIKYLDYGYDLTRVRETLLTGYQSISAYMINKGDEDKVKLGEIYRSIAESIEDEALDKLRELGVEIMYLDDLDRILEALD